MRYTHLANLRSSNEGDRDRFRLIIRKVDVFCLSDLGHLLASPEVYSFRCETHGDEVAGTGVNGQKISLEEAERTILP